MAVIIQLRNDTAANWTNTNPVLAVGEFGIEIDTRKFKIGDGASTWSGLPYYSEPIDSINEIGDINISSLTDGQILKYDSATSKWINADNSGGSGVDNIVDLTDTNISSPSNGEALIYDDVSSKWVNSAVSGSGDMLKSTYDTDGDGIVDNSAKVNNLTVETAVPSGAVFTDTIYNHPTTAGNKHVPAGGQAGDILIWEQDGTAEWSAPEGGSSTTLVDLTDTNISSVTDGQVLSYDNATSKWVNSDASSGGSSTIESLTDTTIDTLTDGQILKYDNASSKWVNVDLAGGGDAVRAGGNDFTGVQTTGIDTTVTNGEINFSNENNFKFTASADTTISFSNPSVGQCGVIIVSTAENIIGWNSSFKWKNTPTDLSGTERFAYFIEATDSISIGRVL